MLFYSGARGMGRGRDSGTVAARALLGQWRMTLELKPPLPPMEALLVEEPPIGDRWQYEPKWDGFRCLVFRDGQEIFLQSKSGQPLARYFPDLVEALQRLGAKRFVLDGEIVIPVAGR